jgi:predicted phosphoribosyltransferase
VALAEAVADPRVVALVLRVPSSDARLAEAVRLSVPTLVIEGEHDPLLARNRELVGRMTCENRLVVVPGAGHLFEEPGTAELAAEATAAWFQRWLAGAPANAGGERTPRRLRIVGVEATAGFSDRAQAGRALAERLQAYRGSDTLVLALPRGGIAVAEPIAQALEADLDVFVSSKLRAPSQPELAIGALAEGDVVLWNDDIVRSLRVSQSERTSELERVRAQLTERLALYRAAAPRLPIKDRTAIVTDDGVATGATLKAAIAAVAREGPRRLVVALPGGPRETLEEIARLPRVHEVVVLVVPEHFYAVGQLYRSFAQVSTDEVCAALRRARRSGG